jgi:hypothetical protein
MIQQISLCRSFVWIKFVVVPFFRFVDDVIFNSLVFGVVLDDVIVKTELPCETGVYFARMNSYHSFILVDDYAQ